MIYPPRGGVHVDGAHFGSGAHFGAGAEERHSAAFLEVRSGRRLMRPFRLHKKLSPLRDKHAVACRVMHPRRDAAIFLACSLVAACAPGGAGRAVRPPSPVVSPGLCTEVSPYGEPLIVDWSDHQRAGLERAMNDHIAVVKYDCESYELLNCSVDGTYGFMGTSIKEERLQLEDKDELAANLPAFGAQLSARVRRDQSLDLKTVVVGVKRTTISNVSRDQLKGECAGATHFVRGAFVGAFSMGTRALGEAAGSVSLLSAGAEAQSSSSETSLRRDGDPQACRNADPSAVATPKGCGALLRLELAALDKKAPQLAGGVDVCPSPAVLIDGKCGRRSDTKPYQCLEGKVDECAAQCERGHVGSCAAYGFALFGNHGARKDLGRAVQLSDRACEAGSMRACSNLGTVFSEGTLVERDLTKAKDLYERACSGGFETACHNLALIAQDSGEFALANTLYDRACRGGVGAACHNLAIQLQQGLGGKPDLAAAAQAYARACQAGFDDACANLAVFQLRGSGVLKDAATGRTTLQSLCDRGVGLACGNLARVMLGDAQPNVGEVQGLARRSCEAKAANGCATLAALSLVGHRGTEKNPALAAQLLEKGCSLGDNESCTAFGFLRYDGAVGPKDVVAAASSWDKACINNYGYACELLSSLYGLGSDDGVAADSERASEYGRRACRLGAGSNCPRSADTEAHAARAEAQRPSSDGLAEAGRADQSIRASVRQIHSPDPENAHQYAVAKRLKGCVDAAIKDGVQGELAVDLVVAFDGRVTRFKLKPSSVSGAVSECARKRLHNARLPASVDGRTQKFSLTFKLFNSSGAVALRKKPRSVITLGALELDLKAQSPPGCTCASDELRAICTIYCE